MQADPFAGKCVADVIVTTFVREMSGLGNDFDFVCRGIDQRLVVLAKAPRTRLVKLRGRMLVERLVRPLMVVGVLPAFETTLLGREVGRGCHTPSPHKCGIFILCLSRKDQRPACWLTFWERQEAGHAGDGRNPLPGATAAPPGSRFHWRADGRRPAKPG